MTLPPTTTPNAVHCGSGRLFVASVAAALELEYLADDWRNVLLQASPVSLPPKVGLIDIWIYGLAPRKFATNAWQHFQQDDHGCALVREIVEGQFSFK